MSNQHPTDSSELKQLRLDYKRLRNGTANATPLRLGYFAGERGTPVSNFGAHSRNWRSLFIRGYAQGSRLAATAKLLDTTKLFNY